MPRVLSDNEINALLAEPKPLPQDWRKKLSLRQKSDARFKQRELTLRTETGNKFIVKLRHNTQSPLDFSVILVFVASDGTDYRLTRYQGPHPSQHTNKLEKAKNLRNTSFRNRFHIHRATERYQREFGFKMIDGYAEPTDRYASFESALDLFLRSNGFLIPEENDPDQMRFRFGKGNEG